ncbi:MAG: hypothetical protein KAG66_11025 [Methylococcales bacterium]|nr:hypothetical protein [Methylococcales bacterium]
MVTIEVHISNGLLALFIVRLPETAVRVALLNSRLDFPARRITIKLAPANLPKAGVRSTAVGADPIRGN